MFILIIMYFIALYAAYYFVMSFSISIIVAVIDFFSKSKSYIDPHVSDSIASFANLVAFVLACYCTHRRHKNLLK